MASDDVSRAHLVIGRQQLVVHFTAIKRQPRRTQAHEAVGLHDQRVRLRHGPGTVQLAQSIRYGPLSPISAKLMMLSMQA